MLSSVMAVLHRLPVLALSVVLIAGNAGVCAGWAATPEARMACCAEGADCAMAHGSKRDGDGRQLTQSEADHCCASAEPDSSNQSGATFAATLSSAVLGDGAVIPVAARAVLSRRAPPNAPLPSRSVPTHVLLSIFLV